MLLYAQQAELAHLKHEELLAAAAWQRYVADARQARPNYLSLLLHHLVEQSRQWLTLRRPVTLEPVTPAARRQTC